MKKDDDMNNRIYSTIPEDYQLKHLHESGTAHVSGRKQLYESLVKQNVQNVRTLEYETLKPSTNGISGLVCKHGGISVKEGVLGILIIILLSTSVAGFVLFVDLSNKGIYCFFLMNYRHIIRLLIDYYLVCI